MQKPIYDLESSGKNMRRLREERRMTAKEVAGFLQLDSPQSVYNWESGKNFPSADNLLALSQLYHMPPEELLVGRPGSCGGGEKNDSGAYVRQEPCICPDGYAAQMRLVFPGMQMEV